MDVNYLDMDVDYLDMDVDYLDMDGYYIDMNENLHQCRALTVKGYRCKAPVHISGKLCKKHKQMNYEGKKITLFSPKKENKKKTNNKSSQSNTINLISDKIKSISDKIKCITSILQLNNITSQTTDIDYIDALNLIEKEIQCKIASLAIKQQPITGPLIKSEIITDNKSEIITDNKPEIITDNKPEIKPSIPPDIITPLICQVCYDQFTEETICKCTETNNHMVCKDCLCSYMQTVMHEKKSVGCMFNTTGCVGRYNDYDLMSILSESDYAKYLECLEVEQAMNMAKIFNNYCLCPFCSKFALTIDDIENMPDTYLGIKCQRCDKSWCVKCRNEAHVPEPCGKIKVLDKDIISRTIERTIDDATIHKCPKCFTKYKKEEENGACNLMTCPTCHTYSCYICGIIIEPKIISDVTVKYWHFKGHNNANKNSHCELYYKYGTQKEIDEGNKEYNNKKIAEGLEKLITINISNLEIACEIVRQINALKFKIKSFPQIDLILEKEKSLSTPINTHDICNCRNCYCNQKPVEGLRAKAIYTKDMYERDKAEINKKQLENEKSKKQCIIM